MFDGRVTQIGAENLDGHLGSALAERFENANGERINFFAGRASRHPNAQLSTAIFAFALN